MLPVNIQVTLIALLLIVVAIVKITIDYKGRNLTKAATQGNNCEKNMEVNLCLPVQQCMENNSVNSAKICFYQGCLLSKSRRPFHIALVLSHIEMLRGIFQINSLWNKGRTSIRGIPRIVRSTRRNGPDSPLSGLFCVTSFRTRDCNPCAAVRLSLHTLWAAQFADANSTARKVLNMYP